jgi:D-alanyl-D-alanine carboxypeptidase
MNGRCIRIDDREDRMRTIRSSKLLAAASVAVVMISLAGCAGGDPAAMPSTDAATPTDAPADAGCVASPEVVATTEPPPGARSEMPETIAAELEAAATAGLEEAATDGAVAAVRSPDGTWIQAFGVADPATGAELAVDEYFRIGSITKTFTGSLVLQLAEEGELSLEDPIDEYVDGVTNGDAITLRMLLDMTSGIASYSLDPTTANTYLTEPSTVWTPDELLAAGLALPPLFEPGAQFNYSNTNFILLGKVIEEVTGEPYPDVLAERILDPLSLDGTTFPSDATIPEPHPQGSSLQGTPDGSQTAIDATDWSPSFAWTAGQLISTPEDMLAWGHALGTGQGLYDAGTSVERLTSFPGEDGGYGMALGCINGWVGHTGEIPGFNTTVFYDTTADTTVIVIANSDIASGDCPVSPTLADNPTGIPCMAPATRIFVSLSKALGNEFTPPPMQ